MSWSRGVKPINENLVTTGRLWTVKVVFAGSGAFVIPDDSSRSRADFITRAVPARERLNAM